MSTDLKKAHSFKLIIAKFFLCRSLRGTKDEKVLLARAVFCRNIVRAVYRFLSVRRPAFGTRPQRRDHRPRALRPEHPPRHPQPAARQRTRKARLWIRGHSS